MKKFFSVLLVAFCTILSVKAEVEFSYEAGAEIVSSYLWRGQYLGALSVQPTLTVGYEGEHSSLSIGAWGSIGASDWQFIKDKNTDYRAYLVPELDVIGSFSFYGVTVGFTHYYYFDGSKFLCWDKPAQWDDDAIESNTSTTEVQLGFNFSEILPENHNLYANWYTMVAGNDFKYDDNGDVIRDANGGAKRNFSSYIELGYDYTFNAIGLTLGAQVGIVPWGSDYYGNERTALKCVSLRIGKEWEIGPMTLELFGQGMMDGDGIDSSNAFIKAVTEEKIGNQKLNGCIGLGFWF